MTFPLIRPGSEVTLPDGVLNEIAKLVISLADDLMGSLFIGSIGSLCEQLIINKANKENIRFVFIYGDLNHISAEEAKGHQ